MSYPEMTCFNLFYKLRSMFSMREGQTDGIKSAAILMAKLL